MILNTDTDTDSVEASQATDHKGHTSQPKISNQPNNLNSFLAVLKCKLMAMLFFKCISEPIPRIQFKITLQKENRFPQIINNINKCDSLGQETGSTGNAAIG